MVEQLVLEMSLRGLLISGALVLALGLSFKENCPDLRNKWMLNMVAGLQR